MEEASTFTNLYTGSALPHAVGDPAPALPSLVLHGIGTGFLQIQPSAVNTALAEVLESDNNV